MPDGGYPTTAASGITLTDLSHQRCLDVLVERMGYAELCAAQVRLRDKALTIGICFIKGAAPIDAERGRGAINQMLAHRIADRMADGAVLR